MLNKILTKKYNSLRFVEKNAIMEEGEINFIIYKDFEDKKLSIYYDENGFEITFPDYCKYIYNHYTNTLHCYVKEEDDLLSTLYNLPYALLLKFRNRFLLHCSSLINDKGDLICFCGSKGVGKSTLVNLFSSRYNIISDDVLCVDQQMRPCIDNDFSLLKIEQIKCLPCGYIELVRKIKNTNKGIYINFEPEKGNGIIKKIYFINKERDKRLIIKKIAKSPLLKIKILSNLVGCDYGLHSLDDISDFSIGCIEVYELILPDSIEGLNRELKRLEDEII